MRHGDTDIFPFPFENHAIFDKKDEFIDLIVEHNDNFEEYIHRFSPNYVNSLTPVTYSGFRWATQIDPIWNAHFLACVIALAQKMEKTRLPVEDKCVFSYRLRWDKRSGDLFDREFSWYQFMVESLRISGDSGFVVVCDISEFYPRLSHHRLENALKQIGGDTVYPGKIMSFLSNFSNTNSFGLPIGGPASRILSELTINQIDKLLVMENIRFTRFADDYHLFAISREDAYKKLLFLSEKLFVNQGLALQKSKTRIMTSAEFRATNPIKEPNPIAEGGDDLSTPGEFMQFSLRFDPYSPTSEDDYKDLKDEIRKFDVLGLLKAELNKSQIHVALSRKIISAIKFLSETNKNSAVLSILNNSDILYPIFSSALMMIEKIFIELTKETQDEVIKNLCEMIKNESHVFRVDVHLCFAIRVIAQKNTPDGVNLLAAIYDSRTSPIVRRDIILTMARWGEWYWLSDLRNKFRSLSGPERRAFIVSSYKLRDEGSHWRDHMKVEFSPFERFIHQWAGKRASSLDWEVPL